MKKQAYEEERSRALGSNNDGGLAGHADKKLFRDAESLDDGRKSKKKFRHSMSSFADMSQLTDDMDDRVSPSTNKADILEGGIEKQFVPNQFKWHETPHVSQRELDRICAQTRDFWAREAA